MVLRAGDKLANYEILARLRTGGMGTLYLATRVGAAGFKQYVAIKVVHPHLSIEPRFVTSFVNEALLGARISHPNVVRVEELGEHRGAYFLAMEYVHGCSLSELLFKLRSTGRMLTAEAAVAIAARVADGLHGAHETRDESGNPLGLVHRDISPQNILVSVSGAVKLIDFGLAKAVSHEATSTGRIAGKIPYMSPEQALGEPLDRRSDVYSLAIVLWEMLTQRRMFGDRDDFAVLDHVRSPTIEPPSKYVPRLPKELDAALMCALQPDPRDRTPNAREFRARILAAVPRAHRVDGPFLAELIGDMMRAELLAHEADLPADVRASIERRPTVARKTAPTMTVERSEAVPLPEPSLRSKIWPRVAGGAVLVAACMSAIWALTPVHALPPPPASPAPTVDETAVETAVAPASAPVPRADATPPSVGATAIVRLERVQPARKPRQAKRSRVGRKSLGEVDGIPLLQKPDF
jgi:serine/threonine-protein kinase